jgi:hypothetical protein
MMRRIVCFSAAMMMSLGIARAATIEGEWTARLDRDRPGKISISLQTRPNSNQGSIFDRSDFTGLSSVDLESKTRVPVRFEVRREAGTVEFEGTMREGRGGGDFSFASHPEYLETLRSMGLRFRSKDEDVEHELLSLTMFDVSTEFIRSMRDIGYDEPLERYVEFRIFGVDPGYVREMRRVGFDHLSGEKLVETRIHGATPDYIRTMRASGEDLSLDQYIESRIFQVTPEFASEMSRAGYPNLRRDVLVQFRIHGVDPDFVHDLRELGYENIPAQKLVEMRIHGVTPEFIGKVEKAGYRHVPVDKLIQMRIFDIDPAMVRKLDDAER